MAIFDFLNIKKYKKEIEQLKKEIAEIKLCKEEITYINLKKEIKKLENQKDELTKNNSLLEQVTLELEENLNIMQADEDFQEMGFYKKHFYFDTSDMYKEKLIEIKEKQKNSIKHKYAINSDKKLILNTSKKNANFYFDNRKSDKFTWNLCKLALRSFNHECDFIISKVKYNNINISERKINKSFELVNNLILIHQVAITEEYLNLKIDELHLKYEYECKKQEEKERQQAIKERMREEAKALKELELARKKLEKETTHFTNAIKELQDKLKKADEKEKTNLINKIKEFEYKLSKLEKSKQDLLYREQNNKAGFVYIISNIGSFGENVYKIGMTRRLNPFDRISELSSASVPFKFDVHAMIFSEDAPALEHALHKKFEKQSVNKINLRKEFFKVSLEEIKNEVLKNHNSTVTFSDKPEAPEYRQSLLIQFE